MFGFIQVLFFVALLASGSSRWSCNKKATTVPSITATTLSTNVPPLERSESTVTAPSTKVPPKERSESRREISSYIHFAHENRAGKIYLLNDKQMYLSEYNYDGAGPYAWFTIGLMKGSFGKPNQCEDRRQNPVLADENGRCDPKPGEYAKRGITLTLPSPYTWKDIEFLGLYCYRYQHMFGLVMIPPEAVEGLKKYEGRAGNSCETVHKRILSEFTRPSTMCHP